MELSGERKLTAADRRAGNRLILEAKSTGKSWAEIASRFGMTERQARRAAASAARLAAEAGLADIDAGGLLEEIIRAQARRLYRLQELIFAEQPAVAVGACKAVASVGEALRGSLANAGLIPGSGGEARLAREIDDAVEAFLKVARETGVEAERVYEEMQREAALARRFEVPT